MINDPIFLSQNLKQRQKIKTEILHIFLFRFVLKKKIISEK